MNLKMFKTIFKTKLFDLFMKQEHDFAETYDFQSILKTLYEIYNKKKINFWINHLLYKVISKRPIC